MTATNLIDNQLKTKTESEFEFFNFISYNWCCQVTRINAFLGISANEQDKKCFSSIIIQFVLHSNLKKFEFDDDLEKPGEQTACKIVKAGRVGQN